MKFYRPQLKHQPGQVVLLIVMLLAVITTVALTLSFRSQSDTQLSKLNEESVNLREAAEGGVEIGFTLPATDVTRRFDQLGYTSANLPGVDVNRSQVIVSNNPADDSLVSPTITNGGMFTFYLAPVTDVKTMTFADESFGRDLNIFYNDQGSSTCTDISLELTIIADTTPGAGITFAVSPRYISDFGDNLGSNTNEVYQGAVSQNLPVGTSGGNTTFRCRARLTPAQTNNGRVLFVRVISQTAGRQTRIGFQANPISALPVQRRSVRSEVWSTNGVLSITVADQSYPQLPADFFVTSL